MLAMLMLNNKRAFTLIELIIVIAISAILAIGAFKSLGIIYKRSKKIDEINKLSLDTQALADQLSILIYDRVPSSVICYKVDDDNFKSLKDKIDDDGYDVIEWVGVETGGLKEGNYSGFIDEDKEMIPPNYYYSPYTKKSSENDFIKKKFNLSVTDVFTEHYVNLIFIKDFYELEDNVSASFGWHNDAESKVVYDIDLPMDNYIYITDSDNFVSGYSTKRELYRFFFVDSAYALALGKDVDKTKSCIKDFGLKDDELENTLFLFYNYRPWKGERFCADKNGDNRVGSATILSKGVVELKFDVLSSENDTVIKFKIVTKKRFKWSTGDRFDEINITKQKVVL